MSSSVRPKIKIPYSQLEKILQILAAAALIVTAAFIAYSWAKLPVIIPTHFGAGGNADGWGEKGTLLMLPIIAVVFYIAFTILERYPWIYNYPCEITEENAEYEYKMARLLLEWMKLIIILTFIYIDWQTICAAQGASNGLGFAFLPVSMVALFGGIGFIIYKMIRHK